MYDHMQIYAYGPYYRLSKYGNNSESRSLYVESGWKQNFQETYKLNGHIIKAIDNDSL